MPNVSVSVRKSVHYINDTTICKEVNRKDRVVENYYSVFIGSSLINKFVAQGNLSNWHKTKKKKEKRIQQTRHIITLSEGLFASWSLLEGSIEL